MFRKWITIFAVLLVGLFATTVPVSAQSYVWVTPSSATDYVPLKANGVDTDGNLKNVVFTINSASPSITTVAIKATNYKTASIQIFEASGLMDMTGATAQYPAAYNAAMRLLGSSTSSFWLEGKPGLSSTSVAYVTVPITPVYHEAFGNGQVYSLIGDATRLLYTTEYGTYTADISGFAYIRACRAGTAITTGVSQALSIGLQE